MDWQPRRLESWLHDRLGVSSPLLINPLSAGYSNENYLLTSGYNRWVLRKPPTVSSHHAAHKVLREFAVLSALQKTDVPVPRPVIACDDLVVIGSPFFIMDYVPGANVEEQLPDLYVLEENCCARIIGEVIAALAELHRQDWLKLALQEVGRPEAYLESQVERWRSQFLAQSDRTQSSVMSRDQVLLIGQWLRDYLPEERTAVLLHGDFQLSNMIFSKQPPVRLLAITDWELAALGDPLLDLASLLLSWSSHRQCCQQHLCPSIQEVAQQYFKAMAYDVVPLNYYLVLAAWKRAIILENRYRRCCLQDDSRSTRQGRDLQPLANQIDQLIKQAEYWLSEQELNL